jgi:hypothetical protein
MKSYILCFNLKLDNYQKLIIFVEIKKKNNNIEKFQNQTY